MPQNNEGSQPPPAGQIESAPIGRDLEAKFQALHTASRRDPFPDLKARRQSLEALAKALLEHQEEIVLAAQGDFGCRSREETRITELMMVLSSLRYAQKHLRAWMRPRRARVALEFLPGRAKIFPQPLGVVGIMAPWNYPFQLIFLPLVSVLAAGNRALLKPSELTPRCAELIAKICEATFPKDQVEVVIGGPEVGSAFVALPFDHLIYTGSTAVGRLVAEAAAPNLTPLTLELGAKSPVVIHPSFPIQEAARRIAFGKAFNAGQTCIAADYVYVDGARRDELAAALQAEWRRFYPNLLNNQDFSSIVNQRHHQRLQGLLDDATAKGATCLTAHGEGEDFASAEHRMPLQLLLDCDDSMKIMQEEIFGPLLPILSYDKLDDATAAISARPRPLALYYFDRKPSRVTRFLQQTVAGMVSVNDVLTHAVIESLPFGGVGASGTGAYHGQHGFDRFSHLKAVFTQSRFHVLNLMNPPYGELVRRFLRFMIR